MEQHQEGKKCLQEKFLVKSVRGSVTSITPKVQGQRKIHMRVINAGVFGQGLSLLVHNLNL